MLDEGFGRRLYVFGDICEELAEQFIYDINELVKSDPEGDVEVVICTDGGCIYSMFAMHDIMRSISCKVCTIGVGKIMSAGTLLLSAGDRRLIFPHASVMIHEPVSENGEARVSNLRKEMDHFETMYEQLSQLYAEYTGKSIEQIKSDLHDKESVYLTAQEALDYGLVDEICKLRKRPTKRKRKVSPRKPNP